MKMYRTVIILFVGILFNGAAWAATPSHTGTLQIVVEHLHSSQPVYLSLWTSKKGFLVATPFKAVKKAVAHGKTTWTIKKLPYGTYAIAAWQDLNTNGKLDKGTFGAPEEPTGFANNATGHFGPPSFQDASIHLNAPHMTVTIKLACPLHCT